MPKTAHSVSLTSLRFLRQNNISCQMNHSLQIILIFEELMPLSLWKSSWEKSLLTLAADLKRCIILILRIIENSLHHMKHISAEMSEIWTKLFQIYFELYNVLRRSFLLCFWGKDVNEVPCVLTDTMFSLRITVSLFKHTLTSRMASNTEKVWDKHSTTIGVPLHSNCSGMEPRCAGVFVCWCIQNTYLFIVYCLFMLLRYGGSFVMSTKSGHALIWSLSAL